MSASWVNAGLLYGTLHRRGHLTLDARLRARVVRLAAATAAMAAVLVLANRWLDPMTAGSLAERGIGLAMLMAAGGIAYFAVAFALGAFSIADLKAQLTRRAPR